MPAVLLALALTGLPSSPGRARFMSGHSPMTLAGRWQVSVDFGDDPHGMPPCPR